MEIPVITLETDKIPEKLKRRRQWIGWRYDMRDGELVKIPLAPWATGHNGAASATDPNNVTTCEQAVKTAKEHGWGIGFCFFSGDGLTGIDIDEMDDETSEIVKQLQSYTEWSPSGKGVHVIVKGKVSKAIKKGKIEAYSSDRFFTVTGEHVEGTPLEVCEAQEVLDQLERKYGDKPQFTVQPVKTSDSQPNRLGWTLQEAREKDSKLDELLRGGVAEFPSPSEADMSTLSKLRWWGFSDGEAVSILTRYRWRDKLQRDDYIQGMMKKLDPVTETAKPKKRRNLKVEEAKLVAEHEAKKRERFLPFMELPNGRLAEQGFDGKEVFFLVYDPKTAKVEKKSEIELEDFILKPINNDEVKDGTILLPSDVLEYESEEKLIEEIREYLNRWHEPPDQLSRQLDVFYCFLTHIKDLVPQIPYRRYLAPWGKGKSAWLETLGWICYRPIILAGSDTDKSVVRKLNNWKGTALIDEADFGDSSFYSFIIKILNIGYDRKTGFYHRSDDNDPNKTLSYSVFGGKLIATRAKYRDLALESRCLTTIGRQNINPVPLFRMERFQNESQLLRNKLMLWRFRNYHRIKALARELEDPTIAKKVYDGASSVSSRVKQVILPLWLIGGDTMKATLTDLAKTIDTGLKIEDPDYLLELQAKDATQEIIDKIGEGERLVNIGYMVNVLYGASDPIYEIPLTHIAKTILVKRGMREEDITVSDTTSVSKNLKTVFESNLGFKVRIGKKRQRIVLIPDNWLKTKDDDDADKLSQTLEDLLKNENSPEGSYKDVHDVTNVHREDPTQPSY